MSPLSCKLSPISDIQQFQAPVNGGRLSDDGTAPGSHRHSQRYFPFSSSVSSPSFSHLHHPVPPVCLHGPGRSPRPPLPHKLLRGLPRLHLHLFQVSADAAFHPAQHAVSLPPPSPNQPALLDSRFQSRQPDRTRSSEPLPPSTKRSGHGWWQHRHKTNFSRNRSL